MPESSNLAFAGHMILDLEVEHPDLVIVEGVDAVERDGNCFRIEKHNAFVNTGLNILLDRLFALGTPPAAVGYIGVSSNSTAVTAATTFLNGASGGTAANTIIKALGSGGAAATSRTNQTVTAGASFTNSDFTSGVFVINKVGLLNTSTDAGTGLIDVIGGTGGTTPYNKTFSVDFTNAGTFTLTPQIAVTAQAA